MDSKEELKEQIIEAARQIFSRYGFKKTTMDDIAEGVNKGKSSMYYYFKSKDEVFKAVIEKEISILRIELFKVIDSELSPEVKLRIYIYTRLIKFKELTNFYQAIKNEVLARMDYVEEIRKQYDENEINHVEKILNQGIEHNVFRIDDARLAAIVIVTAIKGLEIPLFWNNGDDHVESRLQNVLNILFNGIIKK